MRFIIYCYYIVTILATIHCFSREGVFAMIVELVASITACTYSAGHITIILLVVYTFLS